MARKDSNDHPPIDLHLGASVRTSDGHHLGPVGRAIVERSSRRLTNIVVHKGRLLTRDVVVPVERISAISRDVVDLSLTAAEIDRLADFLEEAFVPLESQDTPPLITWEGPPDYEPRPVIVPAADLYTPRIMPFAPQLVVERKGVPPDTADLNAGSMLHCDEGPLGRIVDLLLTPGSGRAESVIVESEGPDPTQWEIPVDELYVAGEDGDLQVRRSRSELRRFERRRAA